MIWKIWMKSKLNSEKNWKIQKKGKLNSEKIWKIWKKDNLNSEIIWKIWRISMLIIITPKENSSSYLPPPSSFSSSFPPSSSSSLYTCIYIVFQNWEESSWNSFLLETANRDQIYHFIHLTLRLFSRNTTVKRGRDRKHLRVLHNTSNITENNRKNGCVIIEGAPMKIEWRERF